MDLTGTGDFSMSLKKISDEIVEETKTQKVEHDKSNLLELKARLQERIDWVDSLLDELKKAGKLEK